MSIEDLEPALKSFSRSTLDESQADLSRGAGEADASLAARSAHLANCSDGAGVVTDARRMARAVEACVWWSALRAEQAEDAPDIVRGRVPALISDIVPTSLNPTMPTAKRCQDADSCQHL